MRRWTVRLVLGAAALGVAVVAWRALTTRDAIPVVLVSVDRGRVESTVANTRAGTVKACRRSRLAPAIGGQVARLEVSEGDRVTAGQLLMALWNADRNAQLQLATSEALAAESRVQEACLTAEVAGREARRIEKLAAQNLVAEDRVDRATTDARAREAACQAAHAALEVARAQIDAARAALALTFLKAPFDGVVAEVNAELGEYVTPSPPGIATLPAVDLIDDRCLYVAAPIDEVDAPRIRTGMSACVSLDAFPRQWCDAKVRRIAPYVLDREKQARTVEVEVELGALDDDTRLLPGYTADVEIVVEARDDVLRVPTEAILEGHQVLVYGEADGALQLRTFEPGIANWRHTQVTSGLSLGERIVYSIDREGVVAGARVTPENASPAHLASGP